MRESRCKASGCILSRERCILYSVLYSCFVVCIVYSESELAQKLLRWSHEKCPKCAEVPWCKPSPPPPASCKVTKYKYDVREKQQKHLRQDSVDFCKSANPEISQLYDVNIKSGQKYELCWYFFMTRVWKILFNRNLFHCRPDKCSKRLKVLRFSFSRILENTTYWEVLGEKGKDRCGDVSLWWLLSKEYKEWAKLGGIVRIIYPKELP